MSTLSDLYPEILGFIYPTRLEENAALRVGVLMGLLVGAPTVYARNSTIGVMLGERFSSVRAPGHGLPEYLHTG